MPLRNAGAGLSNAHTVDTKDEDEDEYEYEYEYDENEIEVRQSSHDARKSLYLNSYVTLSECSYY
jgi:hypothetical protein